MVVVSRCFAFRALITQARIWKKISSSKLDKFTLFTHSFVGWNLENRYKEGVSIFFRLSWHFKREKSVFWKAFFLQNKNWLRVQDFVDKTLRLVRISLLISAIQRVLRFFSGNLFYKSNRKLFSCVCIAWYKHLRGWENSPQLYKPWTSSRVCITALTWPWMTRKCLRYNCALGSDSLSHAGVFRGARFHPSPQVPAQPNTIFLSQA